MTIKYSINTEYSITTKYRNTILYRINTDPSTATKNSINT